MGSIDNRNGNQQLSEVSRNGNQQLSKFRIADEISINIDDQGAQMDIRYRGRLYKAARTGNWDDNVEKILKKIPGVYITEGLETSLHISVLANKLEFVEKLVSIMDITDLAIFNKVGNTAMCLAGVTGNVEIAKVMINKYLPLSRMTGVGGTQPVMMAATFAKGSMVEYIRLELETGNWTDEEDTNLLTECISSNLFDVARKLIARKPTLLVSVTAWEMLTRKPMADKRKKGNWKTYIDSCILVEEEHDENSLKFQSYDLLKDMLDTAFKNNEISSIFERAPQYLFDAAKEGNLELFKLLLEYFPELVWVPNDRGLSLLHVAVEYRQESIFALLCGMDEVKRLVTIYFDETTGDNMLHLTAKLAPKDKLNSVSGAAFQMQKEILWYKEVEKMVPPSRRNSPNNDGKTPSDIFDEEHKRLLKEGEKWTKGTAKSCMLVAALIATVIFAAAFTEPGGNNNEGYPYLLNRVFFQFFSVSEVIGLFSSSTSILMFLSILTARVNKYAFQHSLPCKLMIGLTTLFVSIASMVVAFCTTIFLSYRHSSTGIPVLLLLFACVPIMFISLKFRLIVDIVHSTFVSRFMPGSRI